MKWYVSYQASVDTGDVIGGFITESAGAMPNRDEVLRWIEEAKLTIVTSGTPPIIALVSWSPIFDDVMELMRKAAIMVEVGNAIK